MSEALIPINSTVNSIVMVRKYLIVMASVFILNQTSFIFLAQSQLLLRGFIDPDFLSQHLFDIRLGIESLMAEEFLAVLIQEDLGGHQRTLNFCAACVTCTSL